MQRPQLALRRAHAADDIGGRAELSGAGRGVAVDGGGCGAAHHLGEAVDGGGGLEGLGVAGELRGGGDVQVGQGGDGVEGGDAAIRAVRAGPALGRRLARRRGREGGFAAKRGAAVAVLLEDVAGGAGVDAGRGDATGFARTGAGAGLGVVVGGRGGKVVAAAAEKG